MGTKSAKAGGKTATEKKGKAVAKPSPAASAKAPRKARASGGRGGHLERLRPGQLDGLVLSFMHKHEKDLPMSPRTIAKAIGRSAGAVGNCLERLASAKQVRPANKAPREYDLKGVRSR